MSNLETSKAFEQSEVQKSRVEQAQEAFNSRSLDILAMNEKQEIAKQTQEEMRPLTDKTHYQLEQALGKEFHLSNDNLAKLKEDFIEPLNMVSVMSDAENTFVGLAEQNHAIAA